MRPITRIRTHFFTRKMPVLAVELLRALNVRGLECKDESPQRGRRSIGVTRGAAPTWNEAIASKPNRS